MLNKKKVFFLALAALLLAACQSQQTATVQIPLEVAETEIPDIVATIGGGAAEAADDSSVAPASDTEMTVEPPSTNPLPATAANAEVAPAPETVEVSVPAQVNWPVSFASQAPLSNWDALHEEACEEASMIMAARYFQSFALDKNIMEEAILSLVAWEEENGYGIDLSAAQTVEILNNYFGVKARIISDVNIDRIKYELAKGNLVIIPAAGRDLHNPNYTAPGPLYHMLLIRGYNNREFITNDPGTRKGDGYRYDYATIINAIHDWNPDSDKDSMTEEQMRQGKKVIVIVEK